MKKVNEMNSIGSPKVIMHGINEKEMTLNGVNW